MLYRNGEAVDLKSPAIKKELDDLKKKYKGSFPIIFQVCPNRRKWNEKNKKFTGPMPSIPLLDFAPDPENNDIEVEWRYSKQAPRYEKHPTKGDVLVFKDSRIDMAGNSLVIKNEGQIDLLFFLMKKSRYVEGGENKAKEGGKLIKMVNIEADAKENTARKAKLAHVSYLLFHEDGKLKRDEVYDLAASLFLEGITPTMGDNHLRQHMETILLKASNEYLVDEFLKLVTDKGIVSDRAMVHKAFSSLVLGYNPKKQSVCWMNGAQNFGASVLEGVTEQSYKREAYEYLTQRKELMDRLKERMDKVAVA